MEQTTGVPAEFINSLFVKNGRIDLGYEQYSMKSLLGSGGLGVVIKATKLTGEPVALKFLYTPQNRPGGAEAYERFKQEIKTTKMVGDISDACVRVYECGEFSPPGADQPVPFFAMEYVPGLSLEDFFLLKETPFTQQEIYVVARHIAMALADIHSRGIVHRDIKPSNILFHESLRVLKVTDFGISRDIETPTGVTVALDDGRPVILGTINYLSRYYFDTIPVDKSDVLSTEAGLHFRKATGERVYRDNEGKFYTAYKGRKLDLSVLSSVLLFELATGVNPYTGITFPAILTELMTAARLDIRTFFEEHPERFHRFMHRRPAFIRALDRIIRRGTTIRRNQSYGSAEEIIADLDRAIKTIWGSVPSERQREEIIAALLGKTLVSEYENVVMRIEQAIRDNTFSEDRKHASRIALLYKLKRTDRLMACIDLLHARTGRLANMAFPPLRECHFFADLWERLERFGIETEYRRNSPLMRLAIRKGEARA
jgi:serine/threonine protein kinase